MIAFPVFWTVVTALSWLVLRRAFPSLRTRRFNVVAVVAGLVGLGPWLAVLALKWRAFDVVPSWAWMSAISANLAALMVLLGWPAWRPAWALWQRDRRRRGFDPSRRQALASALVPGASLAVSTGGVAAASLAPRVNRMVMHWPELPPALEGFKVGQITDVHVGPFIGPEHVAAAVDVLNAEGVDLVAMTGDLVDDVTQVPALNDVFRRVQARHGVVGILGNHEVYAGLDAYLRGVKDGPMRLLVDESTVLDHGGARLHVAGVNYPFRGMDGPAEAARRSMEKAMRGAGDADFRLCLAHHPTCWDEARRLGAELTLAGHTHGGQVAFLGRSVFAGAFRYMLGTYEEGLSRLYVSSGLGHWFPFRLGCPAEVAVVELRRGPMGITA